MAEETQGDQASEWRASQRQEDGEDSYSVMLERDAEEDDDAEFAPEEDTPLPADRSRRRRLGPATFSSVMRQPFDINLSTPFDLSGRLRPLRPRHNRRAFEGLQAPQETQVTDRPSSAVMDLGEDSIAIAALGKSSLATSNPNVSDSVIWRSSPPPWPSPPTLPTLPMMQAPTVARRGGLGRGGRGGIFSRVGRTGRSRQGSDSDVTVTMTSGTPNQVVRPGDGGSGAGAGTGQSGIESAAPGTPCMNSSHRDSPSVELAGKESRGRSHQGVDLGASNTPRMNSSHRDSPSVESLRVGSRGGSHQGVDLGASNTPRMNSSHRDSPSDESSRVGSGGMGHQGRRLGDSRLPLIAAHQEVLGERAHGDVPHRPIQGNSPSSVRDAPQAKQTEPEDNASNAESSSDEMPPLCPSPDYASLWSSGPYERCRTALVARTYAHARTLGWTDLSEHDFRQIGLNILCSIPPRILSELIYGNLAAFAKRDPLFFFAQTSPWMQQAQQNAPMVYAVLVVDNDARYIQRLRLMEVVRVLRRYAVVPRVEDDTAIAEAVKVDNAFRSSSVSATDRKHIRAGRHRFLWQQGKRKVKRVAVVEQFCNAVEARCLQSQASTPLLQYIGYAFNYSKRTLAHQKGDRSSFLLQLVRHVLEMLWPGQHELQTFPIFFACDAMEAKVGEVLLTLLGHGLAETGLGLGIHPAGINNTSADMMEWSAREVAAVWDACRAFREERGYHESAIVAELQKLNEIEAAKTDIAKQQEEELAQLQKELSDVKAAVDQEFGHGLVARMQNGLLQDNADIAELQEQGAEVEPLVAVLRAENESEQTHLTTTWRNWVGKKP